LPRLLIAGTGKSFCLWQIITHMTINTPAWWPAILTKRRHLCMAITTKIVKLGFQQWPNVLVGHVAVHAQTTARIVDVVMMAIDAVHDRMIDMRERHRQDRIGTFEIMIPERLFSSERRTESHNQGHQYDADNEYCLHNDRFLAAANVAEKTMLSRR